MTGGEEKGRGGGRRGEREVRGEEEKKNYMDPRRGEREVRVEDHIKRRSRGK